MEDPDYDNKSNKNSNQSEDNTQKDDNEHHGKQPPFLTNAEESPEIDKDRHT